MKRQDGEANRPSRFLLARYLTFTANIPSGLGFAPLAQIRSAAPPRPDTLLPWPMSEYTRSVTAFWATPYSEENWKRLEAAKSDGAILSDEDDEGDEDVVSLPLAIGLPDEDEPRVARVMVHRSLNGEDSDRIHWTLMVSRAPTSAPPEDVVAEGAKIGGRVGLANFIAGFIQDGAPVGSFFITMRVNQAARKCKVLPAKPHQNDPAMDLGRPAIQEQIGYRFENGVNGLEEVAIVYDHKNDWFEVTILARGLLNLKATTWLPYAGDVEKLVLGAFFTTELVG